MTAVKMYEHNPKVFLIKVDEVKVDREVRQRTALDPEIDDLADDIELNGQLHPIIVKGENVLVTGERRLEAFRRRGWPKIRAQRFEHLDTVTAYRVELSENIKRRKLPWQDEVRAVGIYHKMRQQTVGEKVWTVKGTATDLSMSEASIRRYLTISEQLDDPEVAGCTTLDGAFNLIKGRAERARAAASNRGLQIASSMPLITPAAGKEETSAAIRNFLKKGGLDADPNAAAVDADLALIQAGSVAEESLRRAAEIDARAESSPILTADFIEWAEAYDGPAFDVLHVDFPYGKGYKGANSRKTGRAHITATYADDPDIMWELLEALITWQDKLAYPIAHLMFWFDMQFYTAIIDTLSNAGWKLSMPFPLIWHKPGQGIASDPRRRPKHVYETALLFSRGDRKIIKVVDDVASARKDENLHLNQKSDVMLQQFLSMIVDKHTAVLDPTCGSGSALAAAKALGAQRVLGLEKDETNADVARFVLARASQTPRVEPETPAENSEEGNDDE